MKKSIFKSKTFWFNVITAILIVLPQMVELGFELDPKWVGLVMVIGNVILRFITDTAVGITGETPAEPEG